MTIMFYYAALSVPLMSRCPTSTRTCLQAGRASPLHMCRSRGILSSLIFILSRRQHFYDPDRREGAISVAFFRPSVRLSVRPSRTQRKIREHKGLCPNLEERFSIVDATRIPVSRSNGQRAGLEAGGGIPYRPNPAATLLVDIQYLCVYIIKVFLRNARLQNFLPVQSGLLYLTVICSIRQPDCLLQRHHLSSLSSTTSSSE